MGNKTMKNGFIAVDGDSIGKLLEKYIFTNDLDGLCALSSKIQKDIDIISLLFQKRNWSVIMKGGDNILCRCDLNDVGDVIKKILQINCQCEYHFSVGIGNSAVNAYMALKYAKLSGNTVVQFNTNPGICFETLYL